MVRLIPLVVSIRWFALLAWAGQSPGMCPQRHVSDEEMDAATWCRHLVPQGSVYAFLADHRQQLFPPELFADLTRHGRAPLGAGRGHRHGDGAAGPGGPIGPRGDQRVAA